MLKSLIGFFSLNKAFIIIIIPILLVRTVSVVFHEEHILL